MRKDTVLIILGFLIVVIQFFGVPSSWKMVATILLGIFVALVSLSLRHYLTRVSERLRTKKVQNPVYVENIAKEEVYDGNMSTTKFETEVIPPSPYVEKNKYDAQIPRPAQRTTRRRIRQTV